MHAIKFTHRGERDFRKFTPKIKKRINEKLVYYASLKNPLAPARPLIDLPPATHRYRIGKYRVSFFDIINIKMIVTKSAPYTKEEIEQLKELFEVYIKTVIDIKEEVCSAGCDRHYDSEQILLRQGSKQENLWGGGIDIETLAIDCNSMINIRPQHGNRSNEIQDREIRKKFEKLSEHFFKELYGQ